MSKERLAERKAELQNAARRLREAVAQPETDIVRDAVIQRFEFTFELLGRISLFGQGALIFSSVRSVMFVDQQYPMKNQLRRSGIFRLATKQMSPLRGFAIQGNGDLQACRAYGVPKKWDAPELLWKTLKLYLERQGLDCGGPRSTLKQAFAEGLIKSPSEGDVWFQMLDDRNLTSHAYDEALAIRIYQHVAKDYAFRLEELAGKIQSLSWD